MPEIRDFIVTRVQEVRVSANNPTDAVRIADAAFTHGQNADSGVPFEHAPEKVWGNTTGRIRTVETYAKENRR